MRTTEQLGYVQRRLLAYINKHPNGVRPSAFAKAEGMENDARCNVYRAIYTLKRRGLVSASKMKDGHYTYRITESGRNAI